jgi:opacity protein-like surface antigen
MKRLILAAVAAAALSAPAMAANCAKDYKDFWETFDRQRYAKMSAEQIADLSRTALRGYDACTAGDERFTAENFFKKLQSDANAKASDIFKSGAFDPPGAKKK